MTERILEDTPESLTRVWLTDQLGVRWLELTAEHNSTIDLIAGMIPAKDEPLPLRRLPAKDRPAVLQLLRQLPQTSEIQRLAEGKDWD